MYSGIDKRVAKTVSEQWRRQKYNKKFPREHRSALLPLSFLLCMHVEVSSCSPSPLLPPLVPRDLIWSLPELIQVSIIIIALVPALTHAGKEIPLMGRGWLEGNMGSNWE